MNTDKIKKKLKEAGVSEIEFVDKNHFGIQVCGKS